MSAACACGKEAGGPFGIGHSTSSCLISSGEWMPRELWESSTNDLLVLAHERAREITRLQSRLEDAERETRDAREEARLNRTEAMEWRAVATTQAAILAKDRP